MCLYPRIIKNRRYTKTKKNGGEIPPILDRRTIYIPIGCKKCIECRKQKSREWQVRLLEEVRTKADRTFVTLTFSNESFTKLYKEVIQEQPELKGYEIDNAIATLSTRRFLERWRKKYGISLRHWLITELGDDKTEHIHIHGIVNSKQHDEIKKIWGYGYVFNGTWVNEQTINYIIKYVYKTDTRHPNYEPKILCSKGIGSKYTDRLDSQRNKYNYNGDTNELYTNRQGFKMALPIYYRNKIYNEEERQKLWIEKLNKEIRYILGVEIDVKETYAGYFAQLELARAKNKRLGYGGITNYEQKAYEMQIREMKHQKRLSTILC